MHAKNIDEKTNAHLYMQRLMGLAIHPVKLMQSTRFQDARLTGD